jgi:MFS family permease
VIRRNRVQLGRDFAKLWTANAATNVGDGIALAAGPLLVASIDSDPRWVAGAVFVQQLPWLLFSLISGVYVDRLDRRTLLVVVNLIRGVVIGGLAIAVAIGFAGIPLIYLAFFLVGTAETLADNASQSLLVDLVRGDQLPRANARLIATQVVADQFLSPPVGAALFVVAAALPIGLNAVAFVFAALLLAGIKGGRRRADVVVARRAMRAEIGAGLRWLLHHRVLRMLAVSMGLMNLTLMAAFAVLVLYARQRLGLGEIGFGLLLSAMAVGGLLGTLVAGRLQDRFNDSVLLRAGLIVETLTHVVLALVTEPWPAVVTLVFFGMHGSVWSVVARSWRQRVVPEHLRGRVNSVYLLFSVGGAALGSLVSGPVAGAFGITAPFWGSAVVMTVMTVAAWRAFGRHLVADPVPA